MTASSARRARFEEIFAKHEWGGESRSGPGSDRDSTAAYVAFLQGWLARHDDVQRIVEVGCGDWATSELVDWHGLSYVGVDIVDGLIQQNRQRFESENISFLRADFIDEVIPPAHLLIAKDVLQHLSNEAVTHFIKAKAANYRYFLFVNDYRKVGFRYVLGFPLRREIQAPNIEIADGSSRPLRLAEPPFNLVAEEHELYDTSIGNGRERLIYTKEIFVIRNAA